MIVLCYDIKSKLRYFYPVLMFTLMIIPYIYHDDYIPSYNMNHGWQIGKPNNIIYVPECINHVVTAISNFDNDYYHCYNVHYNQSLTIHICCAEIINVGASHEDFMNDLMLKHIMQAFILSILLAILVMLIICLTWHKSTASARSRAQNRQLQILTVPGVRVDDFIPESPRSFISDASSVSAL